jgi:hypothetical protein
MRTLLLRVRAMSRTICRLAIFVLCIAGLAPVTAAQAQSYERVGRPSLYPYEPPPGQPYAVEVAPGAYVIHRPRERRIYRAVGRRVIRAAPHRRAVRQVEKHKSAGRRAGKAINTRWIVREKPLVIETRRVVDDPPTVIERRHYVDDVPVPPRRRPIAKRVRKRAGDKDPRVIHADAEITILGPDRMSIRLIRRDGQALDANARYRHVK